MVTPREFGIYLRELRKGRNLTIRQVEKYAGVSNSYLSLIENGKRGIPSPGILEKLAPAYKISYEELMKNAGYLPSTTKEEDNIPPQAKQGHTVLQNKKIIEVTDEELEYLKDFRNLKEEKIRRIAKIVTKELNAGKDSQAATTE